MLNSKELKAKVHSKVHFFKMKYSIGFYCGGGDIENWNQLTKSAQQKKLQKDWYVRWSYRHPQTKLLTRQNPNIKYGVNIHKNKKDRLKAMIEIKTELESLLKSGYSPYDVTNAEPEHITIQFAFSEILRVKKKEVKETTYKDYNSRLGIFERFLDKNGFKNIKEVDKKIVSNFLNSYNAKNSNSFRAVLSSGFSTLSDLDLVDFNFVREIKNKKTLTKQVKIHSEAEITNAIKLLETDEYQLLVYIYLVSYMFFRPLECVRLEIKNIDFKARTISVETKAKAKKIKLIPNIIIKELQLFVNNRKGKLFELHAKSNIDKRGYLTNRFKKFRVRHNLDSELTPYSFRHYYITKIYLELRKDLTIEETIKQLSLITGHTSKAIFNYIHTNDLELPEDYSNLLN